MKQGASGCAICKHPEIEQINLHLLNKTMGQAEIARTYGISQPTVSRHQRNCVQRVIAVGTKAVEIREGITLVDEIEDIKAKTMAIYVSALEGAICPQCGHKGESLRDPHLALAALRESTAQTKVFTDMLFKYEEMQRTNTDLRNDDEFIEMRGMLIASLDPYPEAKGAAQAVFDRYE